MRRYCPVKEAGAGAVLGAGKRTEGGAFPGGKERPHRALSGPTRSSPGKNREKVERGHLWAEERLGQNLGARGRKGPGQFPQNRTR